MYHFWALLGFVLLIQIFLELFEVFSKVLIVNSSWSPLRYFDLFILCIVLDDESHREQKRQWFLGISFISG